MMGIEMGVVTPDLEKRFATVEANQSKLAKGEPLAPVTPAEKKVANVDLKEKFATERDARVAANGKVGRVEIYTKAANGAAARRR